MRDYVQTFSSAISLPKFEARALVKAQGRIDRVAGARAHRKLMLASRCHQDTGEPCIPMALKKRCTEKVTATHTVCLLARRRLREMARGRPAGQAVRLFVGRRHRLFMAFVP
jgi:hypothetical protein